MRLAFEPFSGSAWMAGTITIRDLLAALNQLGDERPILELVEWWGSEAASYEPYRPFVDGSLRFLFPRPPRSNQPQSLATPAMRFESLPVRARRLLTFSPVLPPVPPLPNRPDEMIKRLGVDCVFSVPVEYRFDRSTALLVWIYDLQHHHFPELLDRSELGRRNRIIELEAERATLLVVKSESVRQDLATFLPQHKDKIRVMRFVSDIPNDVYEPAPDATIAHYNLPAKFIYLPNQFWQHKNHLRVIYALERLREARVFPVVVCTGSTGDHRNPDYFAQVMHEIERAQLQEQFLILGSVPRRDVFALMRQSVCVMNPSIFEGFGLSASEATSLGKRTLLADLPSLREQNPPDAIFFDPNNTDALAERILEIWATVEPGPDLPREAAARETLAGRQRAFAREIVEIASEAVRAFRTPSS